MVGDNDNENDYEDDAEDDQEVICEDENFGISDDDDSSECCLPSHVEESSSSDWSFDVEIREHKFQYNDDISRNESNDSDKIRAILP